MPRVKQVESKKEQERAIDDFLTRGYSLKHQGEFTAKVKDKDWGDVHIHVFVVIFAFLAAAVSFDAAGLPSEGVWVVVILANVTYAIYSWFTAEEVIVKVENDREP